MEWRALWKQRSLFTDQRTKQICILLVISCRAHDFVVGGAFCRYLWIRWRQLFLQREKRRAFNADQASGITCRPCGSESQYAEPFVGVQSSALRFQKAVNKVKRRSIHNRPSLIDHMNDRCIHSNPNFTRIDAPTKHK